MVYKKLRELGSRFIVAIHEAQWRWVCRRLGIGGMSWRGWEFGWDIPPKWLAVMLRHYLETDVDGAAYVLDAFKHGLKHARPASKDEAWHIIRDNPGFWAAIKRVLETDKTWLEDPVLKAFFADTSAHRSWRVPLILPDEMARPYRRGKHIAILINSDGGPECSSWQDLELKEIEEYGSRLRVAIQCGVLNALCDKGLSPAGVLRLVKGFHIAEGRPEGPFGYERLDGLGKDADSILFDACSEWGAVACLTHLSTIKLYLTAHNVVPHSKIGYLAAVVVFYDRSPKRVWNICQLSKHDLTTSVRI